jgi:phosphoglycerate dehydrogenase-like enzyme
MDEVDPADPSPKVAVLPAGGELFEKAVRNGGGEVVGVAEADGIVWTDPGSPDGLGDALKQSPATWVQLPFAGIESFFAAGVVDPDLTWTCAKGIYGHSTAEHALTLLLASARRLNQHVRAETWHGVEGLGRPERQLKRAVVVVFGAGGIGVELIHMLQPLEARVVAVNRSGSAVEGAERTEPTEQLGEVLPQADFVAITAALTDETRGLFDADMIARIPEHAWLVNVARGGLVVTDALVAALREGSIGGAALDVTDPEPLPDGHPLWSLPNVIITPHVANTWDMALPELAGLVERNVRHFGAREDLEGLVDPALGY